MSDGAGGGAAAPGSAEPALAGIRVLELGGGVAAPFCARLLADEGAEVVKVEHPRHGDPARAAGPFATGAPHRDAGALFLALNSGKRSVGLDLASATGRTLCLELARRADIVVSGLRPASAERLGLDDAVLGSVAPRAVRVAITNFGLSGALRDARASELVLCAAGGLAYLTGEYTDPPTKTALNQVQYMGGVHAAVGALAALWHAETTGEGQLVEVSLQEVLAGLLQAKLAYYSYMGCVHRRQPKGRGGLQYALMPCADGYIAPMFVPGANVDWEMFAAFLEVPELLDERFATRAGRLEHGAELDMLLVERFAQRGKFDWFHSAQEWRLTFGVAQTPAELLACPQLESRGFWTEQRHPVAGTLKLPRLPYRTTEPAAPPRSPAPLLGEHTTAVLGELGLDPAEAAAQHAAASA